MLQIGGPNRYSSIFSSPSDEYWKAVRKGVAPAFNTKNTRSVPKTAVASLCKASEYNDGYHALKNVCMIWACYTIPKIVRSANITTQAYPRNKELRLYSYYTEPEAFIMTSQKVLCKYFGTPLITLQMKSRPRQGRTKELKDCGIGNPTESPCGIEG